CPTDQRVGISGVIIGSLSLVRPGNIGWKLGEKKAQGAMRGALLDWALEAVAGDAAVDERSAGPACVLCAGEKRPYQRGLYEGLDHAATPTDLAAFLGRGQTAVEARGVALQGSTTDGAALSPEPIRLVCGAVPQQRWPFHGIKALPHGVWKAVATARERLARSNPKGQRGRPASQEPAARRRARQRTALPQTIRAVFHDRSLCVTRRVKASERKRLRHMPRGLPPLRTLRELMAHRDALCARRGRTQTALDKLKTWRQWVPRCPWMGDTGKKVFAPPLEQALTGLDDTRLPAPSNAVERGNRRHRKRPQSVDRVRSTVC
ncbi:MAG TPA: hypothetical protein VLQ80_02835, partial [Candidatus Saccharimonadia bacterium]|nr:hypothetical protein [Candidatus Saccharimonadia bacterium]